MGIHSITASQTHKFSKNDLRRDPRSIASLSKLAEDHVNAGEFQTAKACLTLLYAERRRYSKTNAATEVKDSWFIRACFTHSRILTHQNKGRKGEELVEEVQRALGVALQGIQLAKGNKRYAHLVYNGSVYFWQAARPLMRKDRWQHVHSKLGEVLAAVKDLSGHIQWKATVSAAMAQCAAAIGKLDEVNQHADSALAFNSQGDNSEELTRAMNTLKVHVNEGNPKGKSADPKDASPALLADLTVQRVLSKFLSGSAAKSAIETAYKKLDPDPASPVQDIPLLQVAMLGFAAVVNGDSEYGISLANRAMSGKNIAAKAWGDFINTHVKLETALPQASKGSCKITKSDVSTLCSTLEELEACLQKFRALVDIVGIHACCRDIWNAGLPLMQHNLRKHIKACFQAAASALQCCSSPLHDLRTRIHLELAKCNMNDDQMIVALEDAEHANALDYSVTPEKAASFHLERPWDRHLQPLLATLRTRHAAAHEAPVLPLEKAALFTQRANESRHAATCSEHLQKAISALQQMQMVQPVYVAPAESTKSDDTPEDNMSPDDRYTAARQLTVLWTGVVKAAWRLHLHALVLLAAPYVAWFVWEPATDHEMTLLQCECSYYEADAAVLALVKQGQLVLEAEPDSQSEVDAESGLRAPAQSINQLRYIAQERILWGMQQAAACSVNWAVVNGAVYCWNAHLPAIQGGRYAQIGEVLLSAARLLGDIDVQHIPQKLLRNLTVAAMKTAKHCSLVGMLAEEDTWKDLSLTECEQRISAAAAALKEGEAPPSPTETDQARLKAALALAELSVRKISAVPCQDLLEMVVQLQLCLGVPATVLPTILPEQRIVAQVLQSVGEINTGTKSFKEAKTAVQESIDALQNDSASNAELWVKLAQCALRSRCFPQALIAGRKALNDSTSTPQALAISATQSNKRISHYQRFWRACAAIVCSQAALGFMNPPTQSLPTQTAILQQALWYSAFSAALISPLRRTDVLTAAAQCSLNAGSAGVEFAAVRGALTEPLLHICTTLNRFCDCSTQEMDSNLHSRLTAMCCACLLSAGRPADAVKAAQQWQKPPAHSSHAHVWAWLIETTRVSGITVEGIMEKLGMYSCSVQAPLWVARSAATSSSQEQQNALDTAYRMAKQDPLLSAQVSVQYSEWLLTRKGTVSSSNCDILEHLSRALLCLSTYEPPTVPQRMTDTSTTPNSSLRSSRNPPKTASTRVGTSGQKMDARDVSTHAQDIIEGVLGARCLDEALRVCLLWSFVAKDSDARFQWLLHGATCATKMAAASMDALLGEKESPEAESNSRCVSRGAESSTETAVPTEETNLANKNAQKAASEEFHAPMSLQDWLLFSMSAAQLNKALAHSSNAEAASKGQKQSQAHPKREKQNADATMQPSAGAGSSTVAADSFTVEPLHCPQRTFTWLMKLTEELQKYGCTAQCLPLLWLQVLLCAQTSGQDSVFVMLLKLADWLQKLGLFHQAKTVSGLVEGTIVVPRSLEAQISKHAQINTALSRQVSLKHPSRSQSSEVLRSAVASIVSNKLPGTPASDCFTSEEAMLQIIHDKSSGEHSDEVISAGTAALTHGISIAGMAPRTRHQLLPMQHQHLLLQKATVLVESSTGDVNYAFGLLRLAVEHSEARDDVDTKARCLLQLSRIEGLAGELKHSVTLAQSAQQLTKDTHTWLQAVIQYSRQRVMSNGGVGDAMVAVQTAMTTLKREAMAYSPPPASMLSSMIPLYLEMAYLHGVASCEATKCGQYGQASQTQRMAFLNQALSTAETYGSAMAHAECTIALCDALQEQMIGTHLTSTKVDPRPHLQHVLALLVDTEQRLAAFAPLAAPMDSPVETVHPVRVMHARVLARLARTHELHALADIKFAEQDRLRTRGSFPLVQPLPLTGAGDSNNPDAEHPQTPAVPACVVENFLVSTEKAALEEQGAAFMTQTPHELYAAAYASSAQTICNMGSVAVECNLVNGALPMLLAEKSAIEDRLQQAQLKCGSVKTADGSAEAPINTESQEKGTSNESTSSQPLVNLDKNSFHDAQRALFDGLSGAVNLKDWNRAVHAAQALLHLALHSSASASLSADEQSTHDQRPRNPAEALAVWQSCRAMLEDSKTLMSHAPQHHTACVLKRLLELRKHPLNSDVEHWCSDMEAADALLPEHEVFKHSGSTAVTATRDAALDSESSAPSKDSSKCKGLKSLFINFHAAAKLLQPVNALMNSFPSHVSVLILDMDQSSSMMHACSIRKPLEESQESLNSTYCHAVIDAAALETVLKRLQRWKQALGRQSQRSDGPQQAPDAPAEGAGALPSAATERNEAEHMEDGEITQVLQNRVEAEASAAGEEEKASSKVAELDLRKEWQSIVRALDQLFYPFSQSFAHAVAPPPASSAPVAEKGKKGAAPAAMEAATVLLCVGGPVSDLPLEALTGLQPAGAVCRDRGIHFSVARTELACGSAEMGESLSLQPVSIAKAAYGVSAEIELQFRSTLQQQCGPEWEGDVYSADRTVAQEHHMAVASEHDVVISALTDDYCTTVHDSTVCSLGLENTKVVVIMEHLQPVMNAAAGTQECAGASGNVNAETCIESAVWSKALDISQGLGFESRMCMLLQRGASHCVSNRWPLPSDLGFGILATALKEQDTELPMAVRKATEALSASEPWQKYSFVFYGIPTVVVKGGTDASQKGKKK